MFQGTPSRERPEPVTHDFVLSPRSLRFCTSFCAEPVSPNLELTAIADVALRREGPALLFDSLKHFETKVLVNLFGTPRRVALGMGVGEVAELRQLGALLASLREPEPPRGLADAARLMEMARSLWNMKPVTRSNGVCRAVFLSAPISFSTFAKNAGAGAIVVLGSARPKIYRNNFQENSFAIQSQTSIYLDARENWWGENPPPGSLFLGPVNLEPWLERPEPEAFPGKMP